MMYPFGKSKNIDERSKNDDEETKTPAAADITSKMRRTNKQKMARTGAPPLARYPTCSGYIAYTAQCPAQQATRLLKSQVHGYQPCQRSSHKRKSPCPITHGVIRPWLEDGVYGSKGASRSPIGRELAHQGLLAPDKKRQLKSEGAAPNKIALDGDRGEKKKKMMMMRDRETENNRESGQASRPVPSVPSLKAGEWV